MNSCCENDSLSNCDLFRDARKVSNDEHINIIPGKTLAEHRLPNFVLILKGAGLVHELAEVCVTIGVAMGEINTVIIVFGGVLKSETVIVLAIAVIAWLNSRAGSVGDRARAEVGVSSELRRILILKRFFLPSSLVVRDVLTFSLPPEIGHLRILNRVN